MLPLIIFILFILITDIYSFIGLKTALAATKPIVYYIGYWSSTIITIIGLIIMFNAFAKLPTNQSLALNLIIGLTFSIIVAKLHFSTFFLLEDIFRTFIWIIQSVLKFKATEFIPRSVIWGFVTLISGSLIIILLNYGVLWGKYHYKVRNETLFFNHLPDSFNGFKIAQLSDMHLGTFDRHKQVTRGLKLVQKQNPDMIVFTGDLVNNKADEALIYIDALKELKAPFGKYTIMGNHDYGDYARWKTKKEHADNIKKLTSIQEQMGFSWLNNKNTPITNGRDTIYLAGVENWGLPPFPQYGDIGKALTNIDTNDFTILLSHDPTHWKQQILNTIPHIALTLSGHTHGMQFGIELGKFKWSPVKYKYPEWAGLYENNQKYLYVNRGFGNIGYPGRIGIRPEITILELRKKE